MTMVKMVIDTDGGVDDAVAILWAATRENIDLLAITVVHGNVDTQIAAENVCRVLELAGRIDIPVYLGESTPLPGAPHLPPVDFIHGVDGLGNTNRPRAQHEPREGDGIQALVDIVKTNVGEVSLVTIGPLTNVALALGRDPSFAPAVKELVVMGGAVTVPGNALPAAEANIAHDPEAARVVVSAQWSMPPLLVGLDITHQATFTESMLCEIESSTNEFAKFLAAPLRFYQFAGGTFCETEGDFPCHDLLATMAAVMPIVRSELLPLGVQTADGPALGATVADLRQPYFACRGGGPIQGSVSPFFDWRIGMGVDVAMFRSEVLRLFAI
jgi:purine nucleosidase